MISKYLKDIGVKEKDLPENWFPNDKRQSKWDKERKKHGFDSRDTWSLDFTFALWIYPRLKMYDEINIIATTEEKYKFKDEEITMQEGIDRMLEGFNIRIVKDIYTDEDEHKVNEAFELFGFMGRSLWW